MVSIISSNSLSSSLVCQAKTPCAGAGTKTSGFNFSTVNSSNSISNLSMPAVAIKIAS